MNYYPLGALSEQDPGALFIRFINPSEFDKAESEIIDYLKRMHSWDFINPGLWSRVGFGGGPVRDFLKSYIEIAGEKKTGVTPENIDMFVGELQRRYKENPEHARDYLNALIALYSAGQVSDTIYRPWTHERTEPYEALTPAVEKSFNKLLLFGLGAVAIYATMPVIVKQFAKGRPRRSAPQFQPYTLGYGRK